MRILLDECVPRAMKTFLESRGHQVRTVVQEGLTGAVNGRVHSLATGQYERLITTDKDFRHPLKFPVTAETGIVFVRVTPMTAERVLAAFEAFLGFEPLESAKGRKLILRAQDFEWVD